VSDTMAQMPVSSLPDKHGKFGNFGGMYIPEILIPAVTELDNEYARAKEDPAFLNEFNAILQEYSGRPTQITFADRMTAALGGAQIYLKREDLNHTGAHKINNVVGQLLLAKRMGKKRIIAETGAGQHGVATATVAAKFGMECIVYMGEEDTIRQQLNVFRMELLGAKVIPVKSGSRTLKDAINEAIRHWVTHVDDTFYCIGSVVGPHPYPMLVRDFQSVIGTEARAQFQQRTGTLPDLLIACVGGGSNAMGLFYPFLADKNVKMIGVEAGGRGTATGDHAATLTYGSPGVLHGMLTSLLQDENGQISDVHSISAGLDYPGVGPEHAFLQESGRIDYLSVTDAEALEAMQMISRLEGIIPALESAHAIACAIKKAPQMSASENIVLCLSGRGDKDMETVMKVLNQPGQTR